MSASACGETALADGCSRAFHPFPSTEEKSSKRPRCGSPPACSFSLPGPWGLRDLFGSSDDDDDDDVQQNNNFYRIRLEYREGGDLAQHVGEARLLLFRDDRPGAIAKIVFSSGEPDRNATLQACVHVLNVKKAHRGHDFGSLLFTEAMGCLKRRHWKQTEGTRHIYCHLDAEEDCERYNKLVHFYEQLGLQVKPHAKIQYISASENQQVYRKIPMHITTEVCYAHSLASIEGQDKYFTPVALHDSDGNPAKVSDFIGRIDWLLIDRGDSCVELRTTKGHCAKVAADGSIQLGFENHDGQDSDFVSPSARFRLLRFSEAKLQTHHQKADLPLTKQAHFDLWMLQSIQNDNFLSVDSSRGHLMCSKRMSIWQAGWSENATLTCTRETPSMRRHYMQKWQTQTVEYVQYKREKYLKFDTCCMSLQEALLEKARLVVTDSDDAERKSVESTCFQRAEWFRRHGYADWIQFTALIYELGRVLRVLDLSLAGLDDDIEHDWTVASQSWVVGCSPPTSINFIEYQYLNPDSTSPAYSSLQGMYDSFCGMENVLLTWSAQQYMSELLHYNKVDLPSEAFSMIRLSSLDVWHSKREYLHLTRDMDENILPFVADFAGALQDCTVDCSAEPEISHETCEHLWNEHYRLIAEKYGAAGCLNW